MKTVSKILLILMVFACVLSILPQNMVMAAGNTVTGSGAASIVGGVTAQNPSTNLSSDLQGVIGKLLGFLQIASGLVSILMIAITGFNYIVGTPDVKDEMKKKMLPIIIGLVLVFGAVSVAKFILSAVTV